LSVEAEVVEVKSMELRQVVVAVALVQLFSILLFLSQLAPIL